MADENNNTEAKSSGGGKGLIIVLIALVVILLVAVVGGGYFLYSQGILSGNNQATTQEVTKKEEANDKGASFKADINDLVLNLTDSRGKEKLMKLSFSIKSTEPTIAAIVENYKAEIIDVVISQISARGSEELLTVGGKNLLKDELMQDINNVINEVTASNTEVARNNVNAILFTTFVIK
jgi:flagellar protein FliL